MIQHYSRNLLKVLRSFLVLLFVSATLPATAQPAGTPVLTFASFATGLSAPLDIVNAGDATNRLFIVQRGGQIRIHNGSGILPTPFLDIRDTVLDNGEQGLLSLAFHPDFETNRYFFVWYTDKEGDVTLARYQGSFSNPNIADPTSEVILLEIPKPGTPYFNNHNGGKINFGPDGYLYVSTGDGGSGGDPFNNAQNGASLFGKMLRLDVNNFNTPPYYSIPPDNPFVTNPSVRDEIWALGLRNPFRWSFDRLTGDMWIGDVGQGAREEVDFTPAGTPGGQNYGWRCYEGTQAFNTSGCLPISNYVAPIFDYPHNNTDGGYSITGGNVYRGSTFPLLSGWYVVADFVSGNVWKIRPNGSGGWVVAQQSGLPGSIAGFGEAENGTLYAVSLGGTVYTVQANSVLPVKLNAFNAEWKDDAAYLNWQTTFEANVNRFEIQYSATGNEFQTVGTVIPSNRSTGSSYTYRHDPSRIGKAFYRLAIVDNDGAVEYSRIVDLNRLGKQSLLVYPTVVENGVLNIESSDLLTAAQIVAVDGRIVFRQNISAQPGTFTLQLQQLEPGNYILQLTGPTTKTSRQIIIR
ncbi:MAG: PQQ-dependent sugar dehydrogenase [Chitinophagaceae bacterium]|nr:PQQ-dependent sugar dehydrogenase [Chitinophagaceae bacterium]